MKHQWQFIPNDELSMDNKYVPHLMAQQGDAFIMDGGWYGVLERDKDGVLLISKDGSQVKVKKSHGELFALYFGGRLQIKRATFGRVSPVIADGLTRPLASYEKSEIEIALMRLEYCRIARRLQEKGKGNRRADGGYTRAARITAFLRRRQKAAELKLPLNMVGLEYVGGSTLKEWYQRWESSGYMLVALIRQNGNKGVRGSKLNEEVVAVVRKYICERYLTLECPPMSAVREGICWEIQQMNKSRDGLNLLHEPSVDSVTKWLNDNFDEFDIVAARKGMKVAIEKFRQIKRAPAGLWPMHTVEIDYTWLDHFCVDDRGNPINGTWEKSRPWIIAAICTLTRMIVGYYITFEAPSWESVMHCLRHMVLPKKIDASYGIQSPYPCFGICEILRMDNERAFRSHSMQMAAGSLGFVADYGPAGQSRLRGKIERFFRTMNKSAFAFVPGKSFSNPGERGDYQSEARATYTFKQLRKHMAIWIVDIYHNSPHSGLIGMTPLQKWEATRELGVKLAERVEDLDAVLALTIQRTVQRQGIRFLGLRYQSNDLKKFLDRRNGKGMEYVVKADPEDLSMLIVMDDIEKKWIYVPCTTPELVEDVSLTEWKRICILARQMNAGMAPSRVILLEARHRLDDEAARKGARPTKRVQVEELDWFRENPDDVVFDNTIDEETPKGKRSLKAKTHGELPVADDTNADVLSSDGPVPSTRSDDVVDAPDIASAPISDPEYQTVIKVDFDDPENWED
ncbi:Mu transposase C-terminal domain-containing protein [Phyllobacterium sp. LjRoot231]|uniref:Mu transposase C-terminal domain-containing protein n=1 Tax=Phyllobacterium sp. LjRoot231 TaxID=3342289 RepID=UPI003ECCA876